MSTTLIYKQQSQIIEESHMLQGILDDCASLLTGAVPPPDGKSAGRSEALADPSGFIPIVVAKNDEVIDTLIRARQLAEYLRMSIQGPPQAESVMDRAISGALSLKGSLSRESY